MQHDPPINPDDPLATPMRFTHAFQCVTGHTGIRDLVRRVTELVKTTDSGSDGRIRNMQIVLAEVLNNIEEHGYGSRPDKQINLQLDIRQDCLAIRTTDFGRAMPGLELPAKALPDAQVKLHDLPEGGFGWFLIHELAPNPVYRRRGNTNILDLIIPNSKA